MDKLLTYLQQGDASPYILGRSQRTRRQVSLVDNNRCTYVIGHSGMGKSTLMTNLILTDIAQGDRSVIVLDPHDKLVESIAARCPPEHAHRVTYFSPSQQSNRVLGFNPFQLHSTSLQEYELKADALMQVFAHTWNLNYSNAPTMQNTLETFIRTLLSSSHHYQTNLLHMLCLTRKDAVGEFWRTRLASFARNNPAMDQNWGEWIEEGRRKTDIESSRQKIKHLITSNVLWPVLCQPTSSTCFDFQDLLANKKVLLVALGGLDGEYVRLLGSFVLTQLVVTAKLYQTEASLPCNVYADEFYYFNPQSFQFIINEGRKHRLYCTIAHQNLSQISRRKLEATVQSCSNIIVFSASTDDAPKLRRHFFAPDGFISQHIVANLPDFQALVRYKSGRKRLQDWIETLPEIRPTDTKVAKDIKQRSLSYGRLRTEIEQIKEGILQIPTTEAVPTVDGRLSTEKPKLRSKAKKPKIKPGFTA